VTIMCSGDHFTRNSRQLPSLGDERMNNGGQAPKWLRKKPRWDQRLALLLEGCRPVMGLDEHQRGQPIIYRPTKCQIISPPKPNASIFSNLRLCLFCPPPQAVAASPRPR